MQWELVIDTYHLQNDQQCVNIDIKPTSLYN